MPAIMLNSVVVGELSAEGKLLSGTPALRELFTDSPFFIHRTKGEGELADGIIETPVRLEDSTTMLAFYGFQIAQQ